MPRISCGRRLITVRQQVIRAMHFTLRSDLLLLGSRLKGLARDICRRLQQGSAARERFKGNSRGCSRRLLAADLQLQHIFIIQGEIS